jgi:hypothetical protein
MVSLSSAWTIIVSLSVSYWLSNIVKSFLIIHNDKAGMIRWLKGYKSDLKIAGIIFGCNVTITYGIGLLGSEWIYPWANSLFTGAGVSAITLSAATFYFSQILRLQSESWDDVIFGIRILSIIGLVGAFYFVPSVGHSINEAIRNEVFNQSSGNMTGNITNKTA